MNKIVAASLLAVLSGCYPLIQDHSDDPPCDSCRAAALAILAGGGFQQPYIPPPRAEIWHPPVPVPVYCTNCQ